jgi:hypothetical protein
LPYLDIMRYSARYQWRQGGPCGGSSCCTDTVLQMIIAYYKDRVISLSEIRWAAQRLTNYNEAPCTGISPQESINALRHYGIYHYRIGSGVTAHFVKDKILTGPVLVGVHYGSYPKNRNGRCGYTNRAELSGKTDCGFNGAHAVLAIKRQWHAVGSGGHTDILTRDPDHYSYSRPERPNYDRMSIGQLGLAMKNLPRYTRWANTYALYPTAKKRL